MYIKLYYHNLKRFNKKNSIFIFIDMGCENKKATHHMTGGLINGSFDFYS
jgi:hypothetical protein